MHPELEAVERMLEKVKDPNTLVLARLKMDALAKDLCSEQVYKEVAKKVIELVRSSWRSDEARVAALLSLSLHNIALASGCGEFLRFMRSVLPKYSIAVFREEEEASPIARFVIRLNAECAPPKTLIMDRVIASVATPYRKSYVVCYSHVTGAYSKYIMPYISLEVKLSDRFLGASTKLTEYETVLFSYGFSRYVTEAPEAKAAIALIANAHTTKAMEIVQTMFRTRLVSRAYTVVRGSNSLVVSDVVNAARLLGVDVEYGESFKRSVELLAKVIKHVVNFSEWIMGYAPKFASVEDLVNEVNTAEFKELYTQVSKCEDIVCRSAMKVLLSDIFSRHAEAIRTMEKLTKLGIAGDVKQLLKTVAKIEIDEIREVYMSKV